MPAKKVVKKTAVKTPAKKTVAKKSVVKKAPVKKSAPAKKVVAAKKPVVAKKTIPVKKVEVKKAAEPAKNIKSVVQPVKVMSKKINAKRLIMPLVLLLILAGVYLLKDEVIVATVNGKPVTRFALIHSLEQQSGSTVLENMTLQMLVEQELKKAGIKVSDEEIDTEISDIETQLAAQGQNLDDLLAAQGLTRKTVREQLALSKGMEELLADKIAVTDEEIQSYYDQNKEVMGDATFDDVKDSIASQLKQQKLSTEQQKWFAEIKKNAKINYFKFAPSSL